MQSRVTKAGATAAAHTMCRWRAQLRADRAQTDAATIAEPTADERIAIERPIDDIGDCDPMPAGVEDVALVLMAEHFADELAGRAAW